LADAEIGLSLWGDWKGNHAMTQLGDCEPRTGSFSKDQYLCKEFKMYIDEFELR
jgi:hypothetical protein